MIGIIQCTKQWPQPPQRYRVSGSATGISFVCPICLRRLSTIQISYFSAVTNSRYAFTGDIRLVWLHLFTFLLKVRIENDHHFTCFCYPLNFWYIENVRAVGPHFSRALLWIHFVFQAAYYFKFILTDGVFQSSISMNAFTILLTISISLTGSACESEFLFIADWVAFVTGPSLSISRNN